MNIIFLGGLFPQNSKNEIVKNSKGVIQYAANTLQWSFVKGIDYYNTVNIITLPYIGSFPFRFKKIIFPSTDFEHINGANDISISFLNLSFFKHFSRYHKAKNALSKYCSNNKEKTTIIIYAIHSPFLKAAIELKKKVPTTKICLIVPDLPDFMSDSENILYQILKKIDSSIIRKCLKEIDSFVLLSDFMVETLEVGNRPWVRIEGIFDNSILINEIQKETNKTILYTGTLARRYGILNLINAFISIKSANYRLWICGDGDTRQEIEQIAKIDNRIIYWGQLPHEEILILQKKATVLVNPRTSEGIYTKFSFPSKTMEYLASGTPTILNKLEGIPDQYFQYCFVPKDESIKNLKETIIKVCEMSQEYLDAFGNKARKFILENKNPKVQVGKIVELLNLLE